MVDDKAKNVPMDELDAEMDELFSAFDGVGASDALKGKTLRTIAAVAGIAGATAAGAASAANASAPTAASAATGAPEVTASAGGKFASKFARSPFSVARIAAVAAVVAVAVAGGSYVVVNAGVLNSPPGSGGDSQPAASQSADSQTSAESKDEKASQDKAPASDGASGDESLPAQSEAEEQGSYYSWQSSGEGQGGSGGSDPTPTPTPDPGPDPGPSPDPDPELSWVDNGHEGEDPDPGEDPNYGHSDHDDWPTSDLTDLEPDPSELPGDENGIWND